jgi:Ala-tRNA(Pro) deacylase
MMPDTVSNFMYRHGVDFDVVRHVRTETSQETAQAAHVPGDRLAKAVVLEDGDEFLIAVIPATHRLDRWALSEIIRRPFFLAEESDFAVLFRDCRRGAVPPIGEAYGVHTIVDQALLGQPEIYFESGDHESVIRVSADAFAQLVGEAERGAISRRI